MRRLLCLLTLLCLVGCAGTTPPAADSPATAEAAKTDRSAITFEDDLGRTVQVERPERVAALIGSFAHVWHLAGGTDTLCAAADDTWRDFDIPLEESVVNLGSSKKVSLEGLLAAEPDFVLASCNTDADLALRQPLEEMGLPTAYFQVSTFEDYLRMLDICTQITGERENYRRYGLAVAETVEAARARADGTSPTVLYIRVSPSGCKVKNSVNSVLGEMLADLDTVNIADSETTLLENLSMETVMAADPDHIFVVLQAADLRQAEEVLDQTLLSDPAWNSLTAVREGRYHLMDHRLYNLKPNERWGEAYYELSKILYP